MYADMDWVAMSLAERVAPTRALYRAFMAVAKRQGIKGGLLLFQALGEMDTGGTDYLSNFRKGKIDKHKARDIHLWLAQNHFDLAQDAAPDLFPHRPTNPFDDFIDRHAILGNLRILRIRHEMGIVQRAGTISLPTTALRLTERFCLEVDTEINGVALAFQKYQRQWHPLPLGADQRRYKGDVEQGTNLLPRAADGKPIPLEETDDLGGHLFVIVTTTDRRMPEDTLALVRRCDGGNQMSFEVHKVAVRFVT